MAAIPVEPLIDCWLGSLAVWSGPAGSDLSTWVWDHSSNSATVAIFTNCVTKRKRAAFLEALRGLRCYLPPFKPDTNEDHSRVDVKSSARGH